MERIENMSVLLLFVFRFVRSLLSGHQAVAIENAALRMQILAFSARHRSGEARLGNGRCVEDLDDRRIEWPQLPNQDFLTGLRARLHIRIHRALEIEIICISRLAPESDLVRQFRKERLEELCNPSYFPT
jgi:hypothetical protein